METTSNIGEPAKCHLLDLPAEMRNNIYAKLSESSLEIFTLDLKHTKRSSDHSILNLAKTCKQLEQKLSSHFYGLKTVRILSPAFNSRYPAELPDRKLKEVIGRFANHHLDFNKPSKVEVHIGDVHIGPPPLHEHEQLNTVEVLVRKLIKTSTKAELRFNLLLSPASLELQHKVSIRLDGPESVAAQLDAAYFNQEHKDLLVADQQPDRCVWTFLLLQEDILRSLFPLWWSRHSHRDGRLRMNCRDPFEDWFKMDKHELQQFLSRPGVQKNSQ